MYRLNQRLAALAATLLLTVVVADVAHGQIYCGGTWTAACGSGTVLTASEAGGIRLQFLNLPDALGHGGGDASRSVITEIYIRFTDLTGNALEDGSGNLFNPLMTHFQGDGPVGASEWGVTRRPNNRHDFFGGHGSTEWSVGIGSVANNNLCGGLIAAAADPADALPNKCQDDYHRRVIAEFNFANAETPVGDIQWDFMLHVNRVCIDENDTECEESDWAHVPGPITTVLVGSGLLGLGGVGWFRRRRKVIDDV
jgi:hypothetical protein